MKRLPTKLGKDHKQYRGFEIYLTGFSYDKYQITRKQKGMNKYYQSWKDVKKSIDVYYQKNAINEETFTKFIAENIVEGIYE